jgi:hypothetical protein
MHAAELSLSPRLNCAVGLAAELVAVLAKVYPEELSLSFIILLVSMSINTRTVVSLCTSYSSQRICEKERLLGVAVL